MDTLEILLNILNILKGKVNIITTTDCLNKGKRYLLHIAHGEMSFARYIQLS